MPVKQFINRSLITDEGRDTIDTFQRAVGKGKEVQSEGLGMIDNTTMDDSIERFDILSEPVEVPSTTIYSQKQTVRIVGQQSNFSNQEEWKTFLLNVVPNTTILNHSFLFREPEDIVEENQQNISFATSEMEHNISFFEYERITAGVDSKVLPNFSLLNYYKDLINPDYRDNIKSLLSMRNTIDVPNTMGTIKYENYYNLYTENIYEVLPNSATYFEANENIFFLKEDYSSQKTTNVPHCIKFELKVAEPSFGTLSMSEVLKASERRKHVFQFIKNNNPNVLGFVDNSGTSQNLKAHSFINWLLTQPNNVFSQLANETFLLEENEIGQDGQMMETLYSYMLYGWALSTSTVNLRDVEEMFNFAPCKKQTIGFKVEKYLDVEFGMPTQTMYFLGRDIKFVDTQVKYGQRYIYKISALVAVMGTQYRYTNLNHSSDDGFISNLAEQVVSPLDPGTLDFTYSAEVDVLSSPSLQIIEMPFSTKEECFVELPPNIPNYQITNDSGKINEIKIFLQENFLEKKENYVPIEGADEDFLEKISLSNDTADGVPTSYYYNSGEFEIYRLDSEPSSIQDFRGHFLSTVKNDVSHLKISTSTGEEYPFAYKKEDGSGYSRSRHASSATYKDYILSNKKYYYLFRAVSEHGNPSPPTEVVEVRLVEDSDESYVEVKPFHFTKLKDYKSNKQMKRFIQIVPNFSQTQINESKLDEMGITSAEQLTQPPDLGVLPESLWNKKFKIRLISKHSGKKIDINLVFKRKLE